ncbi:MAG: hypothetical protein QF437_18985 [Planctomycetota bacterium]|jgi:hypothetical protein|nr:hypothetical protein [Planctomycetota bacterium]
MTCLFFFICSQTALLHAQDMPPSQMQGGREILRLDHWTNPKSWASAEAEVKASDKKHPDGLPLCHLHIPVDHHAGEVKYPIGWPRTWMLVRSLWEKDWRSWDRLEFSIYTESSRKTLPKTPLTLHLYCPDKRRQWHRILSELKPGEWVHYSMPISDMKFVDTVTYVRFYISESNYNDKDVLNFHIGGFRFVRSTECELQSMDVVSGAVFPEQSLKVKLSVQGPPPKVARGIPFTLRKGGDAIRKETLPVTRGLQILEMEIEELELAPGDYSLTAFEDDPQRKKSAAFRVIESPWKK